MRVLLLKVSVMANSYNSLKLEGIFNVDMEYLESEMKNNTDSQISGEK